MECSPKEYPHWAHMPCFLPFHIFLLINFNSRRSPSPNTTSSSQEETIGEADIGFAAVSTNGRPLSPIAGQASAQ